MKVSQKCSFWKCGLSVFEKACCKMLIPEVWMLIFDGSRIEIVRVGSEDVQFNLMEVLWRMKARSVVKTWCKEVL